MTEVEGGGDSRGVGLVQVRRSGGGEVDRLGPGALIDHPAGRLHRHRGRVLVVGGDDARAVAAGPKLGAELGVGQPMNRKIGCVGEDPVIHLVAGHRTSCPSGLSWG